MKMAVTFANRHRCKVTDCQLPRTAFEVLNVIILDEMGNFGLLLVFTLLGVTHSINADEHCRGGHVVSSASESSNCIDDTCLATVVPCIRGFFDATFYAELHWAYNKEHYIECYSDSAEEIRLSRAVNTGTGGALPSGHVLIEEGNSTKMLLAGVRSWDRPGAYRCEIEAEERSAETVLPYQTTGLYFPNPSEVASEGDDVTLRLRSYDPSLRVLWSRDGKRVPAWDGMTEVVIRQAGVKDAGVYSARHDGEIGDQAIARLNVRRCKADMYGEKCERVCPACHNGGICHDLLGVCVCPEGFAGSNCETPCPEGFHGADCSTECGENTNCKYRLFCKGHPLGCSCAPGFEGVTCWQECELGWYGAHCKQPCHCADGPTACNRFTGACSGGCAPGWTGLSCQVRECAPGWYGVNCKQPCHCADGPHTCHQVTGSCSGGCAAGWNGLSCQIRGSFSATLYAELHRGIPSYIECYSDSDGDKIRFSRAVDTGTGGSLPSGVVLTTSKKSARMDLSGARGYDAYGAYRCGFEADERSADAIVPYQHGSLYFPDPCEVANVGDNVTLRLQSRYPNRVVWAHDGRRVPSWNGMMEVHIQDVKAKDAGIYAARYVRDTSDRAVARLSVRKCRANVYGELCDQVCPTCHNGGICHDLLGVCVCPEGFVGSHCETPCPEGFRGDDCSVACGDENCRWRLYCKQHGCSCARGFKGIDCKQECEPGWYGAHCKQPCHCADGPTACNRFTGACSGGCAPGWIGLSCQVRGFFGATFYAEVYRGNPSYIECQSGSDGDQIRFSRVVDTGTGGSLPNGAVLTTSEKSAKMELSGVMGYDLYGAFRCGFKEKEGSVDAVVAYQHDSLYFPDPSVVASVGDNVTLRLYSQYPNPTVWRRDGRIVSSWSGMMEVPIRQVKPEDAGVYHARFEGDTSDRAVVRLSVRRCKSKAYGELCDRECPACLHGGICHDLLGVCVCPEGFVGSLCETPCPEGFRGADCSTACGEGDCKHRLFCRLEPYGCFCARGFTGYDCEEECGPDRFGAGCKQTCRCAAGEDCNRFTGACSGR